MNDVHVIYHANCLDGLMSAAVVYHRFKNEARCHFFGIRISKDSLSMGSFSFNGLLRESVERYQRQGYKLQQQEIDVVAEFKQSCN